MTKADIKKGDYVRVTFEGEVTYHDKGGSETFQVKWISPHNVPRTIHSIEDVMMTKIDPPIQVGDEIDGERALTLPIGSVVLYEPGGGASIKVSETDWTSSRGPFRPLWGTVSVKLHVLHVGRTTDDPIHEEREQQAQRWKEAYMTKARY